MIFSQVENMGHEQVVYCHDPRSGLKAIIGIHDTTLGPALGGTRLWSYTSEEDALRDVLRLSRGMTYKAACAGLSLGGGKAVIIAKPEDKTEAMFRAFGRFVNSLGGRYITAEDVNTSVRDMDNVRLETRFVTGVSKAFGGSGDPSPFTALGVFCGLKAAVEFRLGKKDLRGLKVAVQGVGSVGKHLCGLLHEQGAKIFVSDINKDRTSDMERLYGATPMSEQEMYAADVDVFAPCALGAILNNKTISSMKAKIIAGAANNQLEDEKNHSKMLAEKKVVYCPDYVINAGGLINVYNELIGYSREKATAEAQNIEQSIMTILRDAERENISTHEAANRFAERRIRAVQEIKKLQNVANSPIGCLHS